MDAHQRAPRVAVVGTGTTGAMALWQLARRGVSAVGFDSYAPGHDRGAAGGETRIFRTAYREGTAYVPLLQRAQQLWRRLEDETGQHLLTMTGGLTIGPPDHPDVTTVLACAEQFGLKHEQLSSDEARRRFPQHPVRDGEVAVFDHDAGVLRPEPAVLAAATRAEELGAVIHRYNPVQDIAALEDGVVVRDQRSEHRFDHVVLAPGPWATSLPVFDFVALEVHQITTFWFPAKNAHDFAPSRTPVVIRCGDTAYSCFPAVDGRSVKVSVHSLQRPRIGNAEELTRSGPTEALHAARAAVAECLPGLHADPIRVSSYADCFTPDQHGLVGPLPGQRRLTVLAGFSGHGFKLSPVLGEVAADLATTGTTGHSITHLDPQRFC